MKIIFHGAAQTVTGSCFQVTSEHSNVLVDCGMFQGSSGERDLNHRPFPFNPSALDAVILTHAHIDHSGLIPRLCKSGFNGKIYATNATVDLCRIMLPDSGHIQEMEAEWHNRKRVRQGEAPLSPLYTAEDAMASLEYLRPVHYGEEISINDGLRVRFRDAGHILGSSIIEMWLTEGEHTVKVVFSGDLGQADQPIIRNPARVEAADFVIVESTYGARIHEHKEDKLALLEEVILDMNAKGGKLIIPSFAVGRAQDILYHIKQLLVEGRIPALPVYIDSPMAISATEIFRNNPHYFDDETNQLLRRGESPFEFPNLYFTRSTEESKELNEMEKKAIIISASGMCEAGRILHHLRHNLWRPEANILFVGYQAEGTLGRRILEGAQAVKIFGEEILVKAKINHIDGFSAHADQNALLNWLGGFVAKPKTVFLVHGDEDVFPIWSKVVQERLGLNVVVPQRGDSVDLVQLKMDVQYRTDEPSEAIDLQNLLMQLDAEYLDLRGRLRQRPDQVPVERIEDLRQIVRQLHESLLSVEK